MPPTRTTFADVVDAHDRAYDRLRERTGEGAPESWLRFAPTLRDLNAAIAAAGFRVEGRPVDPGWTVGHPHGETIEWAYESQGEVLARVTDEASEAELAELFGRLIGCAP
jgi:hypothetical protein